MPIDDLDGELTTTTRNEERDRWRRDYSFHDPESDTSEGSQPWIDASTMADAVMPLYHDIQLVAQASDPNKISGHLLKVQAEADGVFKLEAVGSSGAVLCQASGGGGTIFENDEITSSGLRWRCIVTALYTAGDQVPIAGIDTGPATNLPPGAAMRWTSPRPGIIADALVAEQADLSGLTGGRDPETDDEYRTRWLERKATPPASGNDADIIQSVEEQTVVPVQKCFTHPGCLGPGTSCIVFLLKPDNSGSSRIPNPTQISTVLANLLGLMPGDEGIFAANVVADNVNLSLKISWSSAGPGWSDLVMWPAYYAPAGQAIIVSSATDSLNFILRTFNNNYTAITSPVPGQTIGFWDSATATFRRKRILTVTGGGPWTIVCDASNGVSDQTYTPTAFQRAMPWSDSLQSIVPGLQTYLQTLGPGEQTAVFFDEGSRQRRVPENPGAYPSALTTKGLENALSAPNVFDAQVVEPTLPRAATVGTLGTTSFLIQLADFSVFPL